jgi:hypothetical protein
LIQKSINGSFFTEKIAGRKLAPERKAKAESQESKFEGLLWRGSNYFGHDSTNFRAHVPQDEIYLFAFN